jgi:hypothetical protein
MPAFMEQQQHQFIRLEFRAPPDMARELDRLVVVTGLPKSDVLRVFVRSGLDDKSLVPQLRTIARGLAALRGVARLGADDDLLLPANGSGS